MNKVSIVTIVKNDSAGLEKTVKSVTAQTFQDYEFIIIDGASNDGTPDVINTFKQHFRKVISEPDNGIYDAMNKGIASASGEYIIFMNAGDVFASPEVLELVFSSVKGRPDVIYGDYLVDYGYTTRLLHGIPAEKIWQGMLTSHQSTLVRTELMRSYPFDLNLKIGADFGTLYKLAVKGCRFLYTPVTIAVIEPGGVSDRKRIQVYREHLQTVRRYCGFSPKIIIYYVFRIAESWLRQRIKSILPEKTVRTVIKHKADK